MIAVSAGVATWCLALANVREFPGLAAFGRIETERRTADGKLTRTTHYVVMSKRLPAWRMMSITRRHWGIESVPQTHTERSST